MKLSETEKIASIIKLSQNENPFGASPKALQAITENYEQVFRYPNISNKSLTSKIARKFNCSPNNIAISAGSVELIELLIQSFVGLNQNIITSDITFVAYALLAKVHGKECKRARVTNYTTDIKNITRLCDENTKVIFISNPNNPTGTIISHQSLKKLLAAIPSDIIVVSDEAYAEYVTEPTYPDSLKLQKSFPNLLILRTFSKIYGLAGLRIGYAIGHPNIINILRQNRTPFSVNSIATAAALAALDDTEFVNKCRLINEKERDFLFTEMSDMGYNTIPSQGNFMFVYFNNADEKLNTYYSLKNDGILSRDLTPFGAELGLRISVGRPDGNRRLVKKLKQIKATIEIPK